MAKSKERGTIGTKKTAKVLQRPELLAPAGSLEKLKIGLEYGADAFYLGVPPFSMRSRVNNFTRDDLIEGMKLIRKAGKKAYLTLNIYPRAVKIDAFKNYIEFVRELAPDAVIVADPGVFDMVREYYPEGEIHISVQANVLNYRAVEFWKKQGATRVILPRELTLLEIQQIHQKVPQMELEFFVHGAICMAYSGRCLLSNYMTERDSNQGMCAHSCRWKYQVHDDITREQRIRELNQNDEEGMMYLEEEKRPGEFYPVLEDEDGTYIMNSKDMCMLPYLREMSEAGICSFKIEGRNKTEYYLATVIKAYREAIDDMMAGKDFNPKLLDEVMKTANRNFIPGFLFGFESGRNSIYFKENAPLQTHVFAGIVRGQDKKKGLYEVEVRNRIEVGTEVEVMTPKDCFQCKLQKIYDPEGAEVKAAHGGAGARMMKFSRDLSDGAILRIKVHE